MVPTDENLPVPKRECLVCNAPSTGRHYGCVCKLFFRRAFFDAVQSTCRRTPQCDKSAAVSEMCRSCRYSKCLKMGMNPAVRFSLV
ncbi:NHR-19 protein [Aphelenchoides avenae]|nr:NHR-19 protein [Aphelenchus avenae]